MSSEPAVHEVPAAKDPDPSEIALGRTVVPVVNRNKKPQKDKLGFEYAEHCFIGDAITLTLADGRKVAASSYTFNLPDGVNVTYGQINGLAGDFYGTSRPISDGKDAQEQSTRFVEAYDTLANGGSRQPKEATEILDVLKKEVEAVNKALANHQDPSVVYAQLPGVNTRLEWITQGRGPGFPRYLELARINWDHFGADARTAYNAGHATALQKAVAGDLDGAYAMNAFTDHFLEDSFSAGHLRTPRRLLHGSVDLFADICAKYMHDEDCAIGISVKNPAGQSWMVYGDKRALDEVDKVNKGYCVDAVQASADEIYTAYQTKTAPSPENYKAWTYAPTLESARATTQTLATLFNFVGKSERRIEIKNRRLWTVTDDWWFYTTAGLCATSGWWAYPITIDGPKKIIPWSATAVTTPRQWHIHVFYQGVGGGILSSEHIDGTWTDTPLESPIFPDAVLFTPLASIEWDNGNELRIYYLDKEYILQEYCSVNGGKSWFRGEVGNLKVQAATNTSISAFQFGDDKVGIHIRVYCQESDSNVIKEFCNDGSWTRGQTLPVALSGTSISAVTLYWNSRQIRIYYQADDLSIREHCFDEKGWYAGEFNPGKVPGCVTISAIGWHDDGPHFQVYWRNLQNEIVGSKNDSRWEPVGKIVEGLKAGTQFAVAHWNNGENLRLYYQHPNDSLIEMYNDDGIWNKGHTISNS